MQKDPPKTIRECIELFDGFSQLQRGFDTLGYPAPTPPLTSFWSVSNRLPSWAILPLVEACHGIGETQVTCEDLCRITTEQKRREDENRKSHAKERKRA